MSIDKRFALIDKDGDWRHPYLKSERSSGRYGFAIGGDRFGRAEYTKDLRRVIQAVVLEGLGVRARPEKKVEGKAGNTVSLGHRAIKGYWLAPEFFPLIQGAKVKPINHPGHVEPNHTEEVNGLELIESLATADYTAAIEKLEDRWSEGQRRMLLGHASTDGQTLSMDEIASFAGYESFEAANIQYGKLGRLFADHFGIEGLANATQAIAQGAPRDDAGRWRWQLRPALVEALLTLGLIEDKADALGSGDAAREVDADPKTKGIPSTTRQALINARIGQGGYRRRMLHLWQGKCAVSGCSVESALVASHAKAWADSSNEERLDAHNGLLLAASIDRIFDAGLISFSEEGALLVSERLTDDDLATLGLSRSATLREVRARHLPYLREHRRRNGFEK